MCIYLKRRRMKIWSYCSVQNLYFKIVMLDLMLIIVSGFQVNIFNIFGMKLTVEKQNKKKLISQAAMLQCLKKKQKKTPNIFKEWVN